MSHNNENEPSTPGGSKDPTGDYKDILLQRLLPNNKRSVLTLMGNRIGGDEATSYKKKNLEATKFNDMLTKIKNTSKNALSPTKIEKKQTSEVTSPSRVPISPSKIVSPSMRGEKNYTSPASPVSHNVLFSPSSPLSPVSNLSNVNNASPKLTNQTWINPMDFIEFLLEHDSLNNEYCYLKRTSPYSYVIVPYSEIQNSAKVDYLTLSLRGVTHYFNDDTEFFTLQEWIRSQRIYNDMVKIRFFSIYAKWKSFYRWLSNYRSERLRKYSETLEKRLLYLDKDIGPPVMDIKKFSIEMIQNLKSIPILSNEISELSDFEQHQENQSRVILKRIQFWWEKLKQIISVSCEDSLSQFLISNGFHPPSNAITTGASSLAPHSNVGISFTEIALKKNHSQRLLLYIRLSQYLYNTAMTEACHSCVDSIFERMAKYYKNWELLWAEQDKRKKETSEETEARLSRERLKRIAQGEGDEDGNNIIESPLLHIRMTLPQSGTSDTTVLTSPSIQTIQEVMEKSIINILRVFSSSPFFIDSPEFTPYKPVQKYLTNLSSSTSGGSSSANSSTGDRVLAMTDLLTLLSSDEKMQKTIEAILAKVELFCNILKDRLNDIQVLVNEQSINEKRSTEDIYKMDVAEISSTLTESKAQLSKLQILPSLEYGGLFSIDSQWIRELLLGKANESIRKLQQTLPSLILSLTQKNSERIQQHIQHLHSSNDTLQAYITFSKYYEDISADLPIVDENCNTVRELGALLTAHNIRYEGSSVDALTKSLGELKNLHYYAQEKINSMLIIYSKELSTQRDTIKDKLDKLLEKLGEDIFEKIPETGKAGLPLAILKEYKDEFESLEQGYTEMQRYQGILNLEVSELDEVEKVKGILIPLYEFWDGREKWGVRREEILRGNMKEMDDVGVNKEISAVMKIILSAETVLPEGSEIIGNFRESLTTVRNCIPLVLALREGSLKPNHIEEIEIIIKEREARKEVNPEDPSSPVPDANASTPDMNNAQEGEEKPAEVDGPTSSAEEMNAEVKEEENIIQRIEKGEVTLQSFIESGVIEEMSKIIHISHQAKSEAIIQKQLQDIDNKWSSIILPIKEMEKNILVIADSKEIVETCEESLSQLTIISSMKESVVMREKIEYWINNIMMVQEMLEDWLVLQKSFLYQSSIFASNEIKKQLVNEHSEFTIVEKEFKQLMAESNSMLAIKALTLTTRWDLIKRLTKILMNIEKKLEDYLHSKRQIFPRFYFLSNDDLLYVVANYQKLDLIKVHLRKIFDNVGQVELVKKDNDINDIVAFVSNEKEKLPLQVSIKCRPSLSIEDLFIKIESEMKANVQYQLASAFAEYAGLVKTSGTDRGTERGTERGTDRGTERGTDKSTERDRGNRSEKSEKSERPDIKVSDWIKGNIAQSVITISNVLFVHQVEGVLLGSSNRTLPAIKTNIEKTLAELTEIIRTKISDLYRSSIISYVIQQIHNKEILESLIESRVSNISSFQWQKQLRFYYQKTSSSHPSSPGLSPLSTNNIGQHLFKQNPSSTLDIPSLKNHQCIIKQLDTPLGYGYEYTGNSSRLIITPLSDKCFLTISQAFYQKLNTSCIGPAGTGKTETVKELAKTLSHFCVVFNCSDQISYQIVSMMLFGILSSGSWCCFDEFNRIDIEVLSVIAQQLQIVRQGLLSNAETLNFDNQSNVAMRKNLGIFITMNPGYAGRTELPDNLKVNFRTISMMTPNFSTITSIILYSEGFSHYQYLSGKFVELYSLLSTQLSKQNQYDFGLRSMKSVLRLLGTYKRSALAEDNVEGRDVNGLEEEEKLLIKAIKACNLSRLVPNDVVIFTNILSDLFPVNHKTSPSSDPLFSKELKKTYDEQGLHLDTQVANKCVELYSTVLIRFGIILVGNTLTGKTTCYRSLAKTLTSLSSNGNPEYYPVNYHVLNPKAITLDQLYGGYEGGTMEWKDGLASKIIRECIMKETGGNEGDKKEKERDWIVFDGPIDAVWIENMNTVLDDTMMLCLANGERIKLNNDLRMIFEVENLHDASPATVSRCGIIYFSSNDLNYQNIIHHWTTQLEADKIWKKSAINKIVQSFDTYLTKTLQVIKNFHLQFLYTPSLHEMCHYIIQLFNAMTRKSNEVSMENIETIEDGAQQYYQYEKYGIMGIPYRDLSIDKLLVTLEKLSEKEQEKRLDNLLGYCFCLSVSLLLDAKSQEQYYHHFMEYTFDITSMISGGSINDYYFDIVSNSLVKWNSVTTPYIHDPSIGYNNSNIIVLQPDNVRLAYMTQVLIDNGCNIYLMGKTGTCKTMLMNRLLERLKGVNKYSSYNFLMSAKTDSHHLQLSIEQQLDKKSKQHLSCASNYKGMVIQLDDVNLPMKGTYGAQPPLELIRTLCDQSLLYDRKENYVKNISKVSLLLTSIPLGDNATSIVSKRLVSHFHVLMTSDMSNDNIYSIYYPILYNTYSNANSNNMKMDIVDSCSAVMNVIINSYRFCEINFLSTPTNSFYLYNIRDVGKIVQGMLKVKNKNCSDMDTLLSLLVHEIQSVLGDRLTSFKDRETLKKAVINELQGSFSSGAAGGSNIFSKLEDNYSTLLWSPVLKNATEFSLREYLPVVESSSLVKIYNSMMDEYNNTYTNLSMRLIFFEDYIYHVSKLLRTLAMKNNHALLIGIEGNGKRSIAKLAIFIHSMVLASQYSPTNNPDQLINHFVEWLKGCMMEAAFNTAIKNYCVLLDDSKIANESQLDYVNSLLNNSDLPNVWNADESEKIMNDMREILEKEAAANSAANPNNSPPTQVVSRESLYKAFIHRIKDSLHIVLSMSPSGDLLRTRIRKFPALVNCCTIQYIFPWSNTALYSLSNKILSSKIDVSLKETLSLFLRDMHNDVAKTSLLQKDITTTPKLFLDLVEHYNKISEEVSSKITSQNTRLQNGITKLEQTNEIVIQMKKDLESLTPVLIKKQEEAELLIEQVKKDEVVVLEEERKISAEEKIVFEKSENIKVLHQEAQNELALIEPVLQSALVALDAINPKDLTEIKSFLKPPSLVIMTLQAVCVLLEEKPEWETAKILLGKSDLISNLKTYHLKPFKNNVMKKLEVYINNPIYSIESVAQVSFAAKSLCQWTHAINTYSKVYAQVLPKKTKVEEMNRELEAANEQVREKQEKLREVKQNLTDLQQKLKDTLNEKERLINDIELTKNRIIRAETLTELLSSEGIRWRETSASLTESMKYVPGNALLSTFMVNYFGLFTASVRQKLFTKWYKKIQEAGTSSSLLIIDNFDISDLLLDPFEKRDWTINGYPSDSISLQNGIIACYNLKWNLFIDPQNQGMKFLLAKEASNTKLRMLKANDMRLNNNIEMALRTGHTIAIENCHHILPTICQTIVSLPKKKLPSQMRIMENEISIDSNFRMYMLTSLSRPRFSPDVINNCCVINFGVSREGLCEQLMTMIVKKECPEMEIRFNKIVLDNANDNKTLRGLEISILERLNNSQGVIVDDIELIQSLNTSKIKSAEIKERLVHAEVIKNEIVKSREEYLPIARRSSLLYFVLSRLRDVQFTYQYSINFFYSVFLKTLSQRASGDNEKEEGMEKEGAVEAGSGKVEERVTFLIERMTENLVANVEGSLQEKHKMLLKFLIAIEIDQVEKGLISHEEWMFFTTGVLMGEAEGDATVLKKPDALRNITDFQWEQLMTVRRIKRNPLLANIYSHVSENLEAYDSLRPPRLESLSHPLTDLVLTSILQREDLNKEVRKYVEKRLGRQYVSALSNTSIQTLYEKSTASLPILIVLSPGVDINNEVQQFLTQNNIPANKFSTLSLGKGQEVKAQKLVEQHKSFGGIVLLQNCHLNKKFLMELEKIYLSLQGGNGSSTNNNATPVAEDFRLIVTVMPVDYIPVSVLENSLKMTMESSNGLANSMKTMLTSIPMSDRREKEDDESEGDEKESSQDKSLRIDVLDEKTNETYKKLIYALAFFHGVITERKNHLPNGWIKAYDFTVSDYLTCVNCIKTLLFAPQSNMNGSVGHTGSVLSESHYSQSIAHNNTYAPPKNISANAIVIGNASAQNGSTAHNVTAVGALSHNMNVNAAGASAQNVNVSALLGSSMISSDTLPWDTMNYLIGEIHYGGKVTNEYDRRILLAILRQFFNSKVISELDYYPMNTSLYEYRIPSLSTFEQYFEVVESLPKIDAIQVLGLNSNAEINSNILQASEFMEFLNLAGATAAPTKEESKETKRESAGKKESPTENEEKEEEILMKKKEAEKLSLIDMYLSLVPTIISIHEEKDPLINKIMKHDETDDRNPIIVCLIQEIERYNILLSQVKTTLESIRNCILSLAIYTPELENAFSEVQNNRIPSLWLSISFATNKNLYRWFADLKNRVDYIKKVFTNGFPRSFLLSAFFLPENLLTSILQLHSRRFGVAIDSLNVHYEVMHVDSNLMPKNNQEWFSIQDDILFAGENEKNSYAMEEGDEEDEEERDIGYYVHGLYLTNACWDHEKSCLIESKKNVLFEAFPPIRIVPLMQEDDVSADISPPVFSIPTYKTADRVIKYSSNIIQDNFITQINLPIQNSTLSQYKSLSNLRDFWVIRGVGFTATLGN